MNSSTFPVHGEMRKEVLAHALLRTNAKVQRVSREENDMKIRYGPRNIDRLVGMCRKCGSFARKAAEWSAVKTQGTGEMVAVVQMLASHETRRQRKQRAKQSP